MSSEESDSGPGTREVARRLFAAEFNDADFSYSESDEERAPNYVVAPTGERVNRLFAVGVLTEVAQAGDSILRARVADPTGAFVVYAGQYQPEAMAFLDQTEPPAFVALTGKARTFQPDDADVVYTSVRPEEMNIVDRETRDRWAVTTAEQTLHRTAIVGKAIESELAGEELRSALVKAEIEGSLAAGVPLALKQYGTTPAYLSALQEIALDTARLVAGEIDEVGSLSLSPGEGDGTFTPAVDPGLDLPTAADVGSVSGAATTSTAAESRETDASFEPVEESEPAAAGAATTGTDTRASSESEESAGADALAAEIPDESADTEPAGPGDTDRTDAAEEPSEEPAVEDSDDVGFDPDEEVLGDEERQDVEEEYGLDFETGTEVGSPDDSEPEFEPIETGEEPAQPEEPQFESTAKAADAEPEADEQPADEADPGPDPEPEPEADGEPPEESAVNDEPTDERALGDVLMEHMEELDDGNGAPRDELVAAVTEATGADEAAVDDAIEDALMSGRCYEPDDDRYASI